jgi:hypothetical protein
MDRGTIRQPIMAAGCFPVKSTMSQNIFTLARTILLPYETDPYRIMPDPPQPELS